MPLPTFTLLIVEDLAIDRELYRRALNQDSSCTYHLLEAESVAGGLELCQAATIDAILLDYGLPDGDGLAFLAALDTQSNGSSPPVVMVTGRDEREIAVRAMKLGAEDYLVKSDLTPELLQSKMRGAIENARLRLQLQQSDCPSDRLCQRLRISLDAMLDCFGIYTAIRDARGEIIDFRFDYLNAAALESNQMTAADMGRGVCEVLPAICEPGLFEEYCRVVETGIPLYREERNYRDVLGIQQIDRIYDMQINKLDDGFVATWRDVTVQKQAELKLEAKNQQITTIWESMTDAYVTLDRDWRVVYANPAAAEIIRQLVDLAPEEFLGKTHWEVFPSSVGTTELEYRRAVTEQIAVHFEVLYEPTGTWFEVHAYPSEISLGIYFRDITERKQAEAARIAAEAERDRFFDMSLDMLAVCNFEGYFLRLNPAWEKTLGFTNAELMAKPYVESIHPDDVAATLAAAQELSEGQTTVMFENRYRCKDGSYRWLSWNSMPYTEKNLIYATARDITEAKRDDEALRRSEEFNRSILDSHRDCVKVIDLEGRLLYMNDGGQRLMEIDDFTTVEGTQWVEFWQGHDAESVGAAIAAAKSGEVGKFEGYCATFKGTPKWWEVVITPIRDRQGNVEQILSVARDITERKQAASLLQAQQATIQQQLGEIESIYQMAPVGLCFVDTDFRYVRINEQLAQINGSSVAEHIGKTFREVLPEVADDIEPLYRQVMESGEPVIDLEVTGTNRAQPGVERCWLASFYPQTDDRGRIIGVNNVVQEITDRKRLEAARIAAEQERDRFFTQSIDLLAIGNCEGYFERINPAFERLLGFTETEYISRPFIDFVHPADRESTLAAIHSLANGQSVMDFENQCLCKDGSYCWVSWNATPYQQSNCWYGVGRDISLRKQTEIALQMGEQLFRSTFEYTSIGLAHVALDGTWMRVNQKLCEILGYSSAELLATTFQAITEPADLAEDLALVQQLVNGKINEYTLEKRYIHKRGHRVWANLTVTLIRTIATDGQLGIPQYFVSAIQDITERKQAQAELERRNQELDSFVYVVSHDLKAPLRGIANLSEWIEEDLEGSLSVANQQQMNLLRSRVYKMEATIDGLLDYARVGIAVETIEPVCIAELLAEVIDSIAPPPKFTIELPPDLPTLSTRRLPLFQVFANLIGNGIKHHHSEAGKIQISIEDRGDCYEFAIADDGSGIDPEHHDRMFKIFHAVNPQKRSDSTGIGLAIVKKIVEAEGGTIWLESELGKGTTFYFTWLQR
jgi:PAS domain S-box-containing protein